MKIYSWQSLLTEHQYHTWIALQGLGQEINFVLGNLKNEIRERQGWKGVDLDKLDIKVLPQKNWWKIGKEIILQNPEAIHIFGGFWADRRFFPLLLYAVRHGVKTAIMNESYSEDLSGYLSEEAGIISWIKVQLRPILYRIAVALLNITSRGNRVCLFTIGSRAVEQFTRAGFKKDQIFPFGYFVPKQKGILPRPVCLDEPLKIIFVGTLIKRKGLDIALDAVSSINQESQRTEIILDVYGPGDPNNWISASSVGVEFKGVIPFGKAQSVIAQYDFLILPSRYDGWGVVVNEALLQGIPVIVSDQVGAKCLVEASGAGLIFNIGIQGDLVRTLHELERDHLLRNDLHFCATNIAEQILSETAANYLKEALYFYFYHQGKRPHEIWCV